MRIAFLAGASAAHTVKWVNEMADREHEVHLITQHKPSLHRISPRVKIHYLSVRGIPGYFLNVWKVRRLLKRIRPDVLNTHYASGYGTLARLSGFRPNVLSVWGSDVYDFPYSSKLAHKLVVANLRSADRIASTSHVMKKQTECLFAPPQEITVTPFGIDCTLFRRTATRSNGDRIRVGTVKRLHPKYGIDSLIRAFGLALKKGMPAAELVIVGEGPQEGELRNLVDELGLASAVTFLGAIPNHEVPAILNTFDIFVALSNLDSESFGVAVIEASACEAPVIVTDVGGLPEVVEDGKTGFITPKGDIEAAADRIVQLAQDKDLRVEMGKAGRAFVLRNYEWQENADRMEALYRSVTAKK